MTITESIFTIIGSAVGGGAITAPITAWLTNRASKKTTDASAADKIAESARLLVETMRVDLNELKKEVAKNREENLALTKRVYELESELKLARALRDVPNATVSNTPTLIS